MIRSISQILSKRYVIEKYLHFLHRITGIYMLVFLYMHVILASFRIDRAIWCILNTAFSNPVMLSFVVVAIFHGINGLRLILTELGYMVGKPTLPIFPYKASSIGRQQKVAIIIVLILFFIFSAIAFIEFI